MNDDNEKPYIAEYDYYIVEAFKAHGLECPESMIPFYVLLFAILVDDELIMEYGCTNKDVHEVWAVWTYYNRGSHDSLVPYNKLSENVQEMDEPWRKAINDALRKFYYDKGTYSDEHPESLGEF